MDILEEAAAELRVLHEFVHYKVAWDECPVCSIIRAAFQPEVTCEDQVRPVDMVLKNGTIEVLTEVQSVLSDGWVAVDIPAGMTVVGIRVTYDIHPEHFIAKGTYTFSLEKGSVQDP